MNPLEYLILGFLVVMAIGTWVLINAIRRAEDGYQTEHGFRLGIAPPVETLYPHPTQTPMAAPRAAAPEVTIVKPRRPPSSKPPMMPVGMTAADFDTRQTGAPWQQMPPVDSNPPTEPEAQPSKPESLDTPAV